jgi:cell division protein FtsL
MAGRPRSQAQALQAGRRRPALQLVPRGVVSAAGQSVSGMRSDFLRYVDLHPAMVLLTAVAIVALVGVIYLTQVTAVTNANYTLQALQSEHAAMLREKQDLQLQIGRAQALPNIEKLARDKLHMVPIGDDYEYLPVAPGPLRALETTPAPAVEPAAPTPSP